MEQLTDAEVLEYAQEHAWDPQAADFYRRRGFVHSTVDRFGLGFIPNDPAFDRREQGTWDFRESVVIPYEDGLGRLRKLRFKPIREHEDRPKTIEYKGGQPHLYAIRAADNATVYVAEGEPDTMILWQLGFRAVGMPGASQFKDEWRLLFRQPHVERVVLVLDPDKSGLMAAKRVRGLIAEVCEDVRTVRLAKEHDVNDMYLKYGPDNLREALAA